ncbi:MAG: hypothetical protein IKA40_04920 [Clostridia bacterium]|nr:hypothetical protein [Clostridia bacterium]
MQAVELQYDRYGEWTYEGERTRGKTASVAIDGNAPVKRRSVCLYALTAAIFSRIWVA